MAARTAKPKNPFANVHEEEETFIVITNNFNGPVIVPHENPNFRLPDLVLNEFEERILNRANDWRESVNLIRLIRNGTVTVEERNSIPKTELVVPSELRSGLKDLDIAKARELTRIIDFRDFKDQVNVKPRANEDEDVTDARGGVSDAGRRWLVEYWGRVLDVALWFEQNGKQRSDREAVIAERLGFIKSLNFGAMKN